MDGVRCKLGATHVAGFTDQVRRFEAQPVVTKRERLETKPARERLEPAQGRLRL
jgi:hypothetical protein